MENNILSGSQKKIRIYLVITIFIVTIIFLVGMFWLASTPGQSVGLALSFAAGLSMIVLPCTFPLVFVLVPLAMGKNYKKGLLMAILFGLGLIITLSLYGVFVALAGKAFGLSRVSTIMYLIAGTAALVFGLSELKLISLKMPSYRGAAPSFIQNQGDYLKAFFMGLFLGNAGIACPNPATYVILTYIASSGSVLYGVALQSVNGLGRFLPLFAITILAILGVNASGWIMSKKSVIDGITGWLLVSIGAFIIVWGLFGHFWFLNTPIHSGWSRWFGNTGGTAIAEYECCIAPACTQCLEGRWIFENNACECRIHLEMGHLDKVCYECRKGLAEGKSVFVLAEKSAKPAFGVLGVLTVGPIVWYLTKKALRKPKNEKENEEESEVNKTEGGETNG